MCCSGLRSKGLSSALRRTLARGDVGQPPPKRFEPHAEQKVLDEPSSGWNVRSSPSPSRIRIDSGLVRPLTVPTPPEIFLQLVQWHWLTLSNGCVTSKRTPPHRQLPRKPAMTRAYPRRDSRASRRPISLDREAPLREPRSRSRGRLPMV